MKYRRKIPVYEHRTARLKKVTSNIIVDGYLDHNFVADEPCFEFGNTPVTVATTVECLLYWLKQLPVKDTDETIGSCTTSFDEEFWAFMCELPREYEQETQSSIHLLGSYYL